MSDFLKHLIHYSLQKILPMDWILISKKLIIWPTFVIIISDAILNNVFMKTYELANVVKRLMFISTFLWSLLLILQI